MICFITALKIEADPLIRRYALKRDRNAAVFPVFTGEDSVLIVSGVGKINAAMAVTVLFEKYVINKDDVLLVNIGFCGSFDERILPGTLVSLHKITDVDSGRDSYPEISPDKKIRSCYAGCFSKTVRKKDFTGSPPLFDVCDMESYGVIASASRYLSTHRMLFLKIVSDLLRPDALDSVTLESYVEQALPDMERLIRDRILSCEGGPKEVLSKDESLLAAVCEQMGLTVSMSHALKKEVLSYRAKGLDPTGILQSALLIEARGKSEVKTCFAALKERFHG